MRMAREASTAATSRCVFELKAKGQEQGEDAFEKRFAIAKQLIVGRFVLKVDSNGPVFAGLAGGVAHGSSSGQIVGVADDPTWENACAIARGWEDVEALPLNWVECGKGRVIFLYSEVRWHSACPSRCCTAGNHLNLSSVVPGNPCLSSAPPDHVYTTSGANV